MTRYLKKQATSKIGINHIKSIIKLSGCVFHTIHQENDIGIDAIIELFKEEKSTGQLVCIQVKSGDSFYNCAKRTCKIPIENHKDYWKNHTLPVFGIVYIPTQFSAYMIDIKKYLLCNNEAKNVIFPASELNQFDLAKFNKIVSGDQTLVVSYINEFEKLTDTNDYHHFRYLVNHANIQLKELIESVLSSDNIDECLTGLNFKLEKLISSDTIEQNQVYRNLVGPKTGRVIITNDKVIHVEEKGFNLFHNTFANFKTLLINASLY